MSWDLLKRLIESEHFNDNPFLPVSYLSRYADHVGIHYVLCQKLRQFSYEEIEFFLPQLCHLIISVDNESMALEEFIVDLCEESVNAALLTFWFFQTYLHDLSSQPQSKAFRTCRRVYNKVQHIVFGVTEPSRRDKIRDNVLPVSVLASFVLAGVAAPFLPRWAGPLAIGQAKKPRSVGDTIADVSQTQKVQRSHTVAGGSTPRAKRERGPRNASGPLKANSRPRTPRTPEAATASELKAPNARSVSSHSVNRGQTSQVRPILAGLNSSEARVSTVSLPDMGNRPNTSGPSTPAIAGSSFHSLKINTRRHQNTARAVTLATLTATQKVRLLRSHYFRSQTLFLNALEDISNRLVAVPKAARLSALRAELALIAQDLPAEVDVPVICPADLREGSPSRSVHHRIVRLNPAESTVLNSAEKVPYLLMVEMLRGDFDFDPDTESNLALLTKLLSGGSTKRIFDLSDNSRLHSRQSNPENAVDSVFEPVQGDLGSSPLLQDEESDDKTPRASADPALASPALPALSSGANSISTRSSLATPRTSDVPRRSVSPGPKGSKLSSASMRASTTDQSDVSALATHMRTAAHMLTQLDTSGSKRPRNEVAAIKAKIIASMQTLEEQSFYGDEHPEGPTFAAIMANSNDSRLVQAAESSPETEDVSTDPGSATNAGAARMENDQKTGGIQRKGDRDDPSAATFGEDWESKKERVRKASPYGWMKNWDLLSVIVKTGADLRQEAFACQLIQVCWKSWEDAGVPVWVKKMRILVTGESSGLIETITNGVSLHSLKRSLTLATIAAGTNPRGRIATLRDHFIKAFGEADTPGYAAAEDAFVRSLAAYSIISYVLQLKDRHNGNILIDTDGHIIHIDFGFMLSNSPGSVGFEAAPFKLTQDYVDVLGGVESASFGKFKMLCKSAFQSLRKSADSIIGLVDMMSKNSTMPCFNGGAVQTTASLRQRFQLQLSKDDAEAFVETDLIAKSLGSYYTRLYDTFQYRTQGIY